MFFKFTAKDAVKASAMSHKNNLKKEVRKFQRRVKHFASSDGRRSFLHSIEPEYSAELVIAIRALGFSAEIVEEEYTNRWGHHCIQVCW